MLIGFFQPDSGQFGCLSCDSLGDYYQEQRGQSFCLHCASHTQRYIGVLSGANRSACQCKEGAISATSLLWLACVCVRASVSTGPPTAGYHNARLEAGEVRCSVTLSRHRSFPCAASDKTTARFRVCRSVRNVRGHSRLCGCFAVGRTRSACLVWSRPCVCEQVQSAFHVLAG